LFVVVHPFLVSGAFEAWLARRQQVRKESVQLRAQVVGHQIDVSVWKACQGKREDGLFFVVVIFLDRIMVKEERWKWKRQS
jgi:hypothetical protein